MHRSALPAEALTLLSRIEEAGLNASAPPQQRLLDGWLLRFSPGKAKRARCINAISTGRLPLADKLARCEAAYAQAGLPCMVRITPFSQPEGLDASLAERGWMRLDDTRVMLLHRLGDLGGAAAPPLPDGLRLKALNAEAFAEAVGKLRASPLPQRAAHAQRLRSSPVPYSGWALLHHSEEQVLACGQLALEEDMAGLYDIYTAAAHRGQGWAGVLCRHLLAKAHELGARCAYLQVEADNAPARRIYHRLGFADVYAYHYRSADAAAV